MNGGRRLGVALLLGAIATSLSARAGDGGVDAPCTSSDDCAACGLCVDGRCVGVAVPKNPCQCNAECELIGLASCELAPDKPFCPGRCVPAPKSREMACNAGDDAPKLEAQTLEMIDDPSGATPGPAGAVLIGSF